MKLLTASALIAAMGILVAGSGYALSVATPWISKESCLLSVSASDSTAPAIGVQACADRFGYELPNLDFSQEDIAMIDGKGSFLAGRFSADIYNGSSLNLTELTIVVMDPETTEDDEPIRHYYEVDTEIPPKSVGKVSFEVFQEYDQARWSITKARGRLSN
ncbi:hypothetical protein [Vreelandella aquamarina]|uniref:hypothetical protein n=1 Tax=Vreelandella aquamarina TaxID=77097 RepID=UPI00384D9C51